jgi:para-nitrobenzyl esterase
MVTPGMRGGFSPVGDGINILSGQFYTTELASDVPMLLSTTFHEWSMSRTNATLEAISRDEAIEMLKQPGGMRGAVGEKAEEVYDAYAAVFPQANPIEIITLIGSSRKSVIETANAKARQQAPVYLAWFGWEPPMFNGRMRAFHCLDICFWFANTDLMLTHTGGGKRPRELAAKMSDALLNFMHTGDPNGGTLPQWKPYSIENGETMIFDDTPVLKNDPERQARMLL